MSRSFGRFVPMLALYLLASLTCGKDTSAPPLPDEPGPPTHIEGVWSYYEVVGNAQHNVSCTNQGTITIARDSADLTGTVHQTGTCIINGAYADNSGSAPITGNVGAATVRFEFADCMYHGDLFNTPRDSAAGTSSCTVGSLGTKITLTGTWFAIKGVDAQPPQVSGQLVPPAAAPPGDSMFVPGDTLRLTIHASDDHKLHWVGYRIGAPVNLHDSTFTTDTVFDDTVRVAVTGSWEGNTDVVVFARDAAGSATFLTIGTMRVLNGIRRPYQTSTLGAYAANVVYDSARNTLYLYEPDQASVVPLPLNTLTLGTPIALPMAALGLLDAGIDVVPSGDSLIVAIPDSGLGVINLTSGTATLTRVDSLNGVTNVIVTSNRHAFTFGSRDSAFYTYFGIVDRALATGTDTLRREIGINGHLSAMTQMTRSPDQSKIFVYSIGAPSCAYLYSVATDSFGACQSVATPAFTVASASTHGDTWLWGDLLLDDSLHAIGGAIPNITTTAFAGLSPDGGFAYQPRSYGYDKIAVPSGAVVEKVRVAFPHPLTRAIALPDGSRLLLFSNLTGTLTGAQSIICVTLN